MFWGVQKFKDLSLVLQDASKLSNEELKATILPSIAKALDELDDDFQTFSNPPKRSSESEASVKKGIIKIDSGEFKVSEEFINVTLTLAEELNMDEVACAEVIFRLMSDNHDLSTTQLYDDAIAAVHTRRRLIIEILCFFFKYASKFNALETDSSSFSYLARWCLNTVSILNKDSSKPLANNIIDMMIADEQFIERIQEKFRNAEVLNRTNDPVYMRRLNNRLKLLKEEHRQLGEALYATNQCHIITVDSMVKLFNHLKTFQSFGEIGADYTPVTVAIFLSLAKSPDNYKDLGQLYKALLEQVSSWSFSAWGNAILLVAAGSLMGVLSSSSGRAFKKSIIEDRISELRYDNITRSAEKAIDDGAIEFLMCLAWDISPYTDKSFRFLNYRAFFSTSVGDLGLSQLNKLTRNALSEELEHVFHMFLKDLWEVVHTMKINEEDIYMAKKVRAANEHDGVSSKTLADTQPGIDYERFLIFVASLFTGKEEAGLKFWKQKSGTLRGFIQFVSLTSPSPNMMAASCVFLESISSGEKAAGIMAEQVFLVAGTSDKTSIRINLELMLKNVIDCYATYGVFDDQKYKMNMSYYGYEIPPDTLLVTCAHLQFLNTVLRYDEGMRKVLQDRVLANSVDPDSPQGFKLWDMLFTLMHNRSPLSGPILELLGTLAIDLEPSPRQDLWVILDEFLFTSSAGPEQGYLNNAMPGASVEFRMAMLFPTNSPELLELMRLIKAYLVDIGVYYDVQQPLEAFALSFPPNLGENYRTPGIWPYIEIIVDIVLKAADIVDNPTTLGLKLECVSLLERCLDLYNPKTERVINEISVSSDVQPTSERFTEYITKHPFAYVMDSLFDDDIYPILFECLLKDPRSILDKEHNDPSVALIVHTFGVIIKVLKYQHLYFDIALPVHVKLQETRVHTKLPQPHRLGSHTLKSFSDAILYNLAIVPNVFLYVGSDIPELATMALNLLQFISLSPQFVGSETSTRDTRVKSDRLLSTLNVVEERYLIRDAFIEQFLRPREDYILDSSYTSADKEEADKELEAAYFGDKVLMSKMGLMQFLILNLQRDTTNANIAHFILGFGIKGDGTLIKDYEHTGMCSKRSLLGAILEFLKEGPKTVHDGVEYFQTVLLAASAQIVTLLATKPQTSTIFLSHLREIGHYESVMLAEPITSISSRWSGASFGEFPMVKDDQICYSTLYSFYEHRAQLLACASVEIYDALKQGSISLLEKMVNLLVNSYANKRNAFGSDPTKLLSLLDFLEFSEESMLSVSDLDPSLAEVLGPTILEYYSTCANEELTDTSETAERQTKMFQELLWARYWTLSHIKDSDASQSKDPDAPTSKDTATSESKDVVISQGKDLVTSQSKDSATAQSKDPLDLEQWQKIADLSLTSFKNLTKTKRLARTLSNCLEAWSKLLLVVLNSNRMDVPRRSSLILDVFQTIVPKFTKYASYSAPFTSILCSTLTSTLYMYMSEMSSDKNQTVHIDTNFDRTHSLFGAALRVLLMKLSDNNVRRDAYIICYLHLNCCLKEENTEFLSKAMQAIRMHGDKVFSIVSKDVLSNIVTLQVPSVMFLEVFVMAGTALNTTYVVDNLARTNLLTLLVESVMPLGQVMLTRDDVSRSELANSYEVFMQILCLLQQVAQTRNGASYVIQSRFFECVRMSGLLSLDPDTELSSDTDQRGLKLSKRNVKLSTLFSGIFKVVACTVLSLGPENEQSMKRLRVFLEENQKLTLTILRKDTAKEMTDADSAQLVNSVVLLTAITK